MAPLTLLLAMLAAQPEPAITVISTPSPVAQAAAVAPEASPGVCPTCGRKLVGCPVCPADCDCAYPGACGRKGCTCRVKSGLLLPAQDRWTPFAANTEWEVYGHDVDETLPGGSVVKVFRYTQRRKRGGTAAAVVPAPQVRTVTCYFCHQNFLATGPHPICSFCHRVNP